MKKNKAIVITLLIMLIATCVAMVGCGNDAKQSTGGDSQQVIEMKLGHIFATDNSNSAAADKFAELVKERSGGKINISVFGNCQLGGDRELMEGLGRGALEMSIINPGSLTGFNIKYDFSNLYMTDKSETIDAIWKEGSYAYNVDKDLDAENGMTLLAIGENDFRHLTNSKRPITKISDMAGIKFRVPSTPILMNDIKNTGGIPTEMAYGELYTALQQETVDGQENGIVMTYASKLYEVQPYFTYDFHSWSPTNIVISTKIWESLSVENQKIIKDTAVEIAKWQIEQNRKDVDTYTQLMKEAGVTFSEFEPAEYEKLKLLYMEQYNDYTKKVGDEFIEGLKKAVNEARVETGQEPLSFK